MKNERERERETAVVSTDTAQWSGEKVLPTNSCFWLCSSSNSTQLSWPAHRLSAQQHYPPAISTYQYRSLFTNQLHKWGKRVVSVQSMGGLWSAQCSSPNRGH